jgi:M6 family metalloprotease-like protein
MTSVVWMAACVALLATPASPTVLKVGPAAEDVHREILQFRARQCPDPSSYYPEHETLPLPAVADTLRICALRVEFLQENEDDPNTTGNGTFDLTVGSGPFSPAPHDKTYFERNLEALARYYHVQSRGRLTLEYEVFPPDSLSAYQVSNFMRFYSPAEDELAAKVARLFVFIQEALRTGDLDPDIDFSEFDSFVIFHAGADYQHDIYWDTPSDMVTGHATLIPPLLVDADSDSFHIDFATVVPEQIEQDGIVGSVLSSLAHEFGHELGLPDIYMPNFWPGVGYWALMDNGDSMPLGFESESGDILTVMGVLPPNMCAWSRMRLGWEDVVEPLEGIHEVRAASSDELGTGVFRFPLGADEYFLLENRQLDLDGDPTLYLKLEDGVVMGPSDSDGVLTTEYDAGLPGSGILIFHVDEKLFDPDEDAFANRLVWDYEWEKWVAVKGIAAEEADGVQDIGSILSLYDSRYPGGPYVPDDWKGEPQDLWYEGNATEFGPWTEPKTTANDGRATHLRVFDIGPKANVMTFSVSWDWNQQGWPADGSGSPTATEDLVAAVSRQGVVRVWDADGNGLGPAGDPTVATVGLVDLDKPPALWHEDGMWFLLAATSDEKRLHCLELPSGAERDGFPVDLGDRPEGPVAVGDLDGDGHAEAVVTTVLGTVWAVTLATGETLAGWPVALEERQAKGGVAVADMCEGGGDEVLVATTGKLHVLTALGVEAGGWPATFTNAGGTPLPAVGDLDADGEPEVVLASGTQVWAFTAGGAVAEGWLGSLDAEASSAVSLGDIEGDGFPEVLMYTADGAVQCLDRHGLPCLDWPVVVSAEENGSASTPPLVTDVDGDGSAEVLVVSDGDAKALGADGRLVRGWPLWSEDSLVGTGAATDVDGDGDVELFWSDGNHVRGWDLPGAIADSMGWWTHYRGGPAHTGILSPCPTPVQGPDFVAASVFVWPNPAREGMAWISYELGRPGAVTFEVYDAAGTEVTTWKENGVAGRNESLWQLDDVPSGVYLVKVSVATAGHRWVKAAVVK